MSVNVIFTPSDTTLQRIIGLIRMQNGYFLHYIIIVITLPINVVTLMGNVFGHDNNRLNAVYRQQW